MVGNFSTLFPFENQVQDVFSIYKYSIYSGGFILNSPYFARSNRGNSLRKHE